MHQKIFKTQKTNLIVVNSKNDVHVHNLIKIDIIHRIINTKETVQ